MRDSVKHKGESEIIRDLKDNVASKIDKRITITETVEIAALLDLTMKDLIIAEKSEDSVKQLLKEKTLKVVQYINREVESRNTGATANVNKNLNVELESRDSQSTTSFQSASASTELNSMNSDTTSLKRKLLNKYCTDAFEPGLANEIDIEISLYINYKVAEECQYNNPVQLWKHDEKNFKRLALLAKTYLCASSSSVEQMFSSTGLILNLKRSSMAPYPVNIVLFVHENYAKFFPITRSEAQGAMSYS